MEDLRLKLPRLPGSGKVKLPDRKGEDHYLIATDDGEMMSVYSSELPEFVKRYGSGAEAENSEPPSSSEQRP